MEFIKIALEIIGLVTIAMIIGVLVERIIASITFRYKLRKLGKAIDKFFEEHVEELPKEGVAIAVNLETGEVRTEPTKRRPGRPRKDAK